MWKFLRLTLTGPDDSCGERSVWEVMVARTRIFVGWCGADGAEATTLRFDVLLPQLLVPTSSADNMNRALHHPLVRNTLSGIELLMRTAEIQIRVDESDAALSNDRLWGHWLKTSRRQLLVMHHHCSLHRNHLVEAFLLLALGAAGVGNCERSA